MINRKGFTLIELLAVIVIIGVVSLITVPVITKVINNTSKKVFESNALLLQESAENYYKMNITLLPQTVSEIRSVSISTLIAQGFSKAIKNPNDTSIICDGYVNVEKTSATNYKYTPYLNCGENMITDGYYENAIVDYDGLVAYWKLDGNATDSSIYNNHGTIYGATAATNRFGAANKALKLDGVNDYVNCGHDASLMPSSITISVWLKFSPTEATNWMVINKAAGGTSGSYYIYGNNINDNLLSIFGPTGTRYNTAIPAFQADTWYHIVSSFNETTGIMKTYVNGQLKNSTSNAELGSNDADVLLGCYTAGYYLDGYIDDIRIYNRALSDDEVVHMYDIESRVSK